MRFVRWCLIGLVALTLARPASAQVAGIATALLPALFAQETPVSPAMSAVIPAGRFSTCDLDVPIKGTPKTKANVFSLRQFFAQGIPGMPFQVYDTNPDARMQKLLDRSEDLKQIRGEWHRFWMNDEPAQSCPNKPCVEIEIDFGCAGGDWMTDLVRDCLQVWGQLWARGDYREAELLAERAARMAPTNVDAQHALVVAQIVNGAKHHRCADQPTACGVGSLQLVGGFEECPNPFDHFGRMVNLSGTSTPSCAPQAAGCAISCGFACEQWFGLCAKVCGLPTSFAKDCPCAKSAAKTCPCVPVSTCCCAKAASTGCACCAKACACCAPVTKACACCAKACPCVATNACACCAPNVSAGCPCVQNTCACGESCRCRPTQPRVMPPVVVMPASRPIYQAQPQWIPPYPAGGAPTIIYLQVPVMEHGHHGSTRSVRVAVPQTVPRMPAADYRVAPPMVIYEHPVPRPQLAIPVSRVVVPQMENRVRLETPQFAAQCNKMTCVGGGDVVVLEGNVEMECHRQGTPLRVTGQRVRVYLSDGTFTVEMANDHFVPVSAQPVRRLIIPPAVTESYEDAPPIPRP